MCGIAGMVDLTGNRRLDAGTLDRMVDVLHLRGPDDRGTSIQPPVAMGIRRLSIIDLEGGHQPMESEDGSVRVVLNGELYSFPEIRKELLAKGYRFRTRADSEVLVHGYLEWGLEGLIDRLNGMFAFALQDLRNDRFYLVRDRLGIKPLLYTERDGTLIFGSAFSSLLASGLVPIEPDPTGIRLYLHNQFIPWPYTAVAGVRKLPPASYLEVHAGTVGSPVRYWHLPDDTDETRSIEDWSEELRELLTDAVRVHMLSDVEMGAFLSGGVDSSIIVRLMSRLADHPVKVFSIGFEDQRIYDETRFAESAARQFGAEFHHTTFTANHVVEVVRDLIRNIEEPIGDPACLPTFYLSRQASRLVKVVLTGEGADELFAGYGYYQGLPVRRPGGRNNLGPGGLEKILARMSGDGDRIRIKRRFNTRSRWSGFPYAMTPRFIEHLISDLGSEDAEEIGQTVAGLEGSWLPASRSASHLSRALHVDIQGWLAEDLLMKVDRTTMAHSLEARVPFLDYRVVELAMRMPAEMKIRGGVGKVILREAMRDLVGAEFIDREKHGFNLPLRDWVGGELRPLIDGALSPENLSNLPWLNRDAVRALFEAHDDGRGDFSRQIWDLFILVEWFRGLNPLRV
jgi:asparagine synthase (glutamine-hydrolysing)